jgi:methylmalonyl-CoA/ethylmalonyl-CoA epimerase
MNDGADVIGLGQVSRSVASVDRAEAWYRDVLGLAHLYTFDKIAFFEDSEGRPIAIMSSSSAKLAP